MNERERRIGQNEALFRHVNERLRDVNDAFGSVTGDFEIVCECGDVDCAERIMLTAEEYRDVRADPRYFAVRSGHVAEDVEEVIEHCDRFRRHPEGAGSAGEAREGHRARSLRRDQLSLGPIGNR